MQAILDIFIFLVTVFSIIVCVNGQLTIIDLGICCYAIIRKMQQCYSSIVGEVAFLEVWGWEKPHKKWCVLHYLLIAFLNGAYIALPDTNIVLKCFFSWFFYFEDFLFLYYSSKSANVFWMFVWHIYPAPRLHGCRIGIGWDEMNAIIYPSNHNLCTGACREQDLPSSNIFDKWKESDLRELFSKNRLTIFIFHCWNKILLLKKYQVDTFMV